MLIYIYALGKEVDRFYSALCSATGNAYIARSLLPGQHVCARERLVGGCVREGEREKQGGRVRRRELNIAEAKVVAASFYGPLPPLFFSALLLARPALAGRRRCYHHIVYIYIYTCVHAQACV